MHGRRLATWSRASPRDWSPPRARPARRRVLSAREREVLRLIAAGLSNKQIARALGITERTVQFHVTSLFGKLGATSRAQAVALASQRHLI